MEIKKAIVIAKDFSDIPGARYYVDGKHSGEKFLNEILRDAYLDAVKDGYKILIDLDGVWGYPSSFISSSFGKLSLENGASRVLAHIEFKSEDSLTREDEFVSEIKNPRKNEK